MLNLPDKLNKLEKEGQSIKVGIIGVGQMGAGLAILLGRIKGMDLSLLADVKIEKAISIFEEMGIPKKKIFYSDDPFQCNRALENDKKVATSEAKIVPYISYLNVIVEATGVPDVGAKVAFDSIRCGKDIIMMNVEADVTVGCLLADLAKAAKVIYTVGAGDEPGAIKEIYDFASALGFRIVAAGKGKNNPLNHEATPKTLKQEALKRGVSPKMLTEFVDGSKTMIEMSCVANATGLVPDIRGMHGPECRLTELPSVFALKENGGILNKTGVVDYALGNVAPGVFVVVSTDNDWIKKDLKYLKMGPGPNYLLYRPYHLTNIEIPLSIARAVIYREPTITSLGKPVAETITVAKRNLTPGTKLDGIGGFDVYGSIEKSSIARKENLLPLGLSNNAVIRKNVKKGEYITYHQVELNDDSFLVNLRKLQDSTFPL